MTVLVTGGAGYIGSHTVRLLRSLGRDVVVLDSMETGYEAALLGAPLVVGDAGDRDLVRRTVREHAVDSVIHFAGYKNAGESMQVPAKYFENNVVATARLLEAVQGSAVRSFVFSGSCSESTATTLTSYEIDSRYDSLSASHTRVISSRVIGSSRAVISSVDGLRPG